MLKEKKRKNTIEFSILLSTCINTIVYSSLILSLSLYINVKNENKIEGIVPSKTYLNIFILRKIDKYQLSVQNTKHVSEIDVSGVSN